MTKYKPEIVIDVQDWDQEYVEREMDVTSDDAICQRLKEGAGVGAVAKGTLIARLRGQAPEDIIAPDKMLLYSGARQEISVKALSKRAHVTLENGTELTFRALVAPVAEDDGAPEPEDTEQEVFDLDVEPPNLDPPDDDPAFVSWSTPKAVDRARRYLLNVVPGYVRGRLEIIAANGGDVWAEISAFKSVVDGIGGALT